MARMHSRKKGKSGSTRLINKTSHSWIRYKPKEVELLVTKFAKEGKSPSIIGIHMRDTYGIPCVKAITKKSITQILIDKKQMTPLPENLTCLLKRVMALTKHLEKNKHDVVAARGLILTESKVRRLLKYYHRTKVLPVTWKYNRKNVNLLIE